MFWDLQALAANMENIAKQEEYQEEYKALGKVLNSLADKVTEVQSTLIISFDRDLLWNCEG
jgi:hypothetical protein